MRDLSAFVFLFLDGCRLENQKLKELVTGGASVAGPSAAQSDTEAAEAKEEPVKEEAAAVRPKMEVNTPQKVGRSYLNFKFFFYVKKNETKKLKCSLKMALIIKAFTINE